VTAELNSNGAWSRGYVYSGSSLLAVQDNGVYWVHEDPVTKSKRTTDINGDVVSIIETDPWGADTNRSSYAAFQPKRYTSYDRDGNGSDEAMFRRYNRQHSRFDQPDPYDGSYDLSDPQSFNRYAYVQNDPANFADPTGLAKQECFTLENGQQVCVDVISIYIWDRRGMDRAFWRNFVDNSVFAGFTGGSGGTGGTGNPQNPVSGPNDQNTQMLNHAFADASSAIAPWKRGKNPCLTFFTQGGRSLEEVSKLFSNFWKTAQMNPSAAPSIAGTTNSGQGMNARVTFYAPFFANTGETEAGKLAGYNWEPARGRYEELFTSLTPRQYRGLTVLHEFAHALGLIPSDKNGGSQSQTNDQTIYDKCGKFLSSLPAQ
jgi:RHS repeat-associated protein